MLLTGGSAFGLAAADGVVRWLERNGRGYDTPGGLVPLVPGGGRLRPASAATRRAGPGPAEGEAACEAATSDPQLGSVGAGTGAAVGKLRGREFAVKSGVGLAKQHLPQGAKLAALAVVNAFGDVIGEDGQVLAGHARRRRQLHRHDAAAPHAADRAADASGAASRSRTRRWCA